MGDERAHPPIDDELIEAGFQEIVDLGVTIDVTMEQIPGMRAKLIADLLTDEALEKGGAIDVTQLAIPTQDGSAEIPVLIMRPAGRTGALPCVYYTANGGKILQHPRVALTDVELDWVTEFGCVFVSVAGRVGPEHPHPALVEDAYAGLVWIGQHASELDIDLDRLVIMGKSGGGGLCAATVLYARDHGGPTIAHQMLIYPMLDDRAITHSSSFEGIPWDRNSNQTGWRALLGDAAGGPDVSQYAAAARADDLRDLPPAYLEVGSSELFRDETIQYAFQLAQADVPIELHSWMGGYHAFEINAPHADVSRAAIAARTSYLRRALRGPA